MAVSGVAHHEPERRQVVRRFERLGVAEVDLVLPGGDFVMPRLDLEPHRHQVLDDQPSDLLRPVHRRQVEVAAAVVRLGGGVPFGVELENEELGLDPRHHFEAEALGPRDLPFQRLARAPGERGPVGVVDVADHAGDLSPLVVVRKDAEGAEVGLQHHVRFLDTHEALDRGAVEHHVPVERLLELARGDLDVLVDAEDVGELQAQERHALFLGEVEDVALCRHRVQGG